MKRVTFSFEYLFRASPHVLHEFFTAPDCLIRWFCDECDATADEYIFTWNGSSEGAYLVDDIEEELVRYQWHDADDGEYLEFKISTSEVTAETILHISGFCDQGDVKSEHAYWNIQVENLRRATGG